MHLYLGKQLCQEMVVMKVKQDSPYLPLPSVFGGPYLVRYVSGFMHVFIY